MKRAALACVLTAGCGAIGPHKNPVTARHVGPLMNCPGAQISFTQKGTPDTRDGRWVVEQTASGCGRVFTCFNPIGSGAPVCRETDASQARYLQKLAAHRVAFENNCAADRVHLVRKSDFVRDGEQAFVFDACGARHLCQSTVSQTLCRPHPVRNDPVPAAHGVTL